MPESALRMQKMPWNFQSNRGSLLHHLAVQAYYGNKRNGGLGSSLDQQRILTAKPINASLNIGVGLKVYGIEQRDRSLS